MMLSLVNVAFGNECYWSRSCIYPHYASKSPYDSCRGDIRDHPQIEGCEAVSFWLLVRHGNRNPGDSATDLIRNVTLLKDEIIASFEAGNSQLCAQDIEGLKQWTWNETMDVSQSFLTAFGYEEQYDLAQRLREKYPEVLSGSDNSYYFRPTGEQRTITSAIAFAHGLTDGTNISISIDQPQDWDQVIRTYQQCDRYQELVKTAPIIDEHLEAYHTSVEYAAIVDAVNQRLGISHQVNADEVFGLYEACRFFRSWSTNTKSPWCSMFTNEDLLVLEYRDDIRHYHRNGYGSWVNVNLGKPPMKDLYDKMTNATRNSGNTLTAYFSHDTMMEMVWCALGLYKDADSITGSTRDPERLWRSSHIGCLNTNMIAVLNRCRESGDTETFRVQIFINEKETDLCPVSGCTWDEFVMKFVEFSDADLDFCSMNYTGPLLDSGSWSLTISINIISLCLALLLLR